MLALLDTETGARRHKNNCTPPLPIHNQTCLFWLVSTIYGCSFLPVLVFLKLLYGSLLFFVLAITFRLAGGLSETSYSTKTVGQVRQGKAYCLFLGNAYERINIYIYTVSIYIW